ncbi:MAG TPA: hypothetical protein VL200_03130 [Lacunisphaera sp.]|nr:hypothetical protein [Lacunisphaera sp.]
MFGTIFLPVMLLGVVQGVQGEDAVCDSDAFWMTRPISPGRLLAAKATGLVLMSLLPVAVTLPWWLGLGYDAGQLLHAAKNTLAGEFLLVLFALPLAMISRNGSRFVMHAFLVMVVAMLPIAGTTLLRLPGSAAPSLGLAESRYILMTAVWLVAAVAIVAIQYRTRRTSLSLVLLVATAFSCGILAHAWKIDFRKEFSARAELPLQNAGIEVRSATIGPGSEVMISFTAAGLPAGTAAQLTGVEHRLREAGTEMRITPHPIADDGVDAAVLRMVCHEVGQPALQAGFTLPPAEASRLVAGVPVDYSATLEGNFDRLEIVGEVPTRVDARVVRTGVSLRTEFYAVTEPAQLVIPLSESAPETTDEISAQAGGRNPVDRYVLVNPDDGLAFIARWNRPANSLTVATVSFFRTRLSFSMAGFEQSGITDLPAWLARAKIVKVRVRETGRFREMVDRPRLVLSPAPAAGR